MFTSLSSELINLNKSVNVLIVAVGVLEVLFALNLRLEESRTHKAKFCFAVTTHKQVNFRGALVTN